MLYDGIRKGLISYDAVDARHYTFVKAHGTNEATGSPDVNCGLGVTTT